MSNFDDLNNTFNSNNSSNGQGSSNPAKIILIGLAVIILFALALSACSDSGNSNSKSSSSDLTCQYDGCSAKAVGPTYEFCSYHKKMLNEIWDAENRSKQ